MAKKDEQLEEKKIIIPGEEIISSMDYLPGRNCYREGNSIYSKKLGIIHLMNRVISVIPLSGVYIPKSGDMVIGEVVDIHSNGWVVDIKSTHDAYLPLSGVRRFIDTNKTDLSTVYAIGDVLYAKISSSSADSTHLSMQDIRAKKFISGRFYTINTAKVPRVIGKEGSMIKMIKDKTDCRISVGQNGTIWFEGGDEKRTIEILDVIQSEAHKNGLTNKISGMFNSSSKGAKSAGKISGTFDSSLKGAKKGKL
jgi:exosome complex component RRP4